MKSTLFKGLILIFLLLQTSFTEGVLAQLNSESALIYGDALPDAPELSARGDFKV